ncbi:filamentous hemagglutinin N-terminal domain-containing protein [Thalassospira sp. NFXS8]|uniref:filamentous hemagglutinin N-terminal domain-containing protein n=1 Tax=Thalassospira sp. NFXS8 TaxID=2819093 RepID=UPI0032DEDCE1
MSKNSFSNPSRRPLKSAHSRSSAVRATGEALAPARKRSGKGLTPFNILAGATALGSFFYATAHPAQAQSALPQGGTVVGGDVSIAQPSSDTLNVVQGSNSAIVNWQSFNVGSGNTVNFQQPGSSSVILNRVVGNDPSAIFGTITANGTVMLVNPNGVVFGKGSRVDVGGLVATTANIRDADFMSGNYNFDIASANPSASIVNAGDISIRDAGLAALVAPNVQNAGVIHARLGKVALGGAKTFSLDFHGDGLLSFGVGSDVDSAPVGTDGNPVDALVSNSGSIIADGGVVSISARAVKDVIDNVINTSGVIQANSVSSANGRIILSGGDNGTVVASGSIKAAGDDSGETGGSIVATGEKIAVASGASMDASGDAGGGLVAIGSEGDGAKGRGTGAWSNTVSIAKTASLKADAITSGDGGTITVLSETLTNFAGSISAKGGATGGNGGFAEVSSHKGVKLTGTVDLTALNGDIGTFLLDPDSLTIVAGAGGSLDGVAGDGTVAENDDNNGANTISAGVLEGIAGTTNIVLESTGLITVSTDLSLQTTSGHSFTLRSTGLGGITFSDASYKIVTQGGDIVLQATSPGASITNIGQLFSNGEGNPGPVSAGGNITVLAARDIQLKGGLYATGQTTSGNITLTSIAGSITASSLSGKSAKLSTGTGNIGASGNAISVRVDDLEINAGGSFFVNVSTPLKSLNLSLDHLLSTDTQTYQLTTSQGFQSFDLTDTADAYVLNTILTHTPSLNFTFSGEKSLTLGTVSVGTGDVSLTVNKGSVTGAEGGKVTASALTIAARDGITGVSGDNQALATDISTLNATTETGGIRIYNNDADDSGLSVVNFVAGGGAEFTSLVASTYRITLGHVSVGAGEIGIGSLGNDVIDDGDDSTFIDAAKLTLLAGAGDNGSLGKSGRALSTNARELSLFAANNIYLDATATSGTVTFTKVQAANGEIGLTTHTSTKINDIGHDTYDGPSSGNSGNIAIVVDSAATSGTAAFLDIDALDAGAEGDVTLTLTNGYVNADDLKGDDLVVSATVLASASNNSTNSLKTTVNTVDVTTPGESANLVIAETDALTVRNVQTAAGTSSITISNQSGDLTIAKIDSTAAVSLNAAGGAVVALDGNSVKGTTLKLAANGAIGSSEHALYTYVTALDIDNTGNIYIQNINSTLTSLVIKNAHDQNQSANVISLTSDHLAFAVSDDATSVSLNKLTSANLETVSFETDSNLVVGQIGTANASVSLTAGGNIADDGNANTRIVTSGKLSLSAQKAIGTSSASVEVIADDVTLNAGSDVYFRDISDLDTFSLTLGNADSEHANNYKIEAQGLEFALTHSLETGYHLDKVFDLSGLTFDFGTDADLSVGALDVSYSTSNSITLRSKGAIKDDGSSTTSVLANTITLSADKNIGESNDHLSLMAESLTAGAADGGIYIDVRNPTGSSNYVGALSVKSLNAAGDIVLTANHGDVILAGQVKTNDHNLTLTVEDGSLLGTNSGSINAGTAAATVITSGDIGRDSDGDYSNVFTVSAAQLDLQAGGLILTSGSRAATITLQADGDTASYTLSNGDLTVQGISVADGNGTLNLTAKSGSIIDDTQDQGVISADKVALVAQSGSITNISSTATDVALTAANGISFTSSNTLTNLSVEAKSTLADGATVGANGQSVAISSANSVLTVGNVTGGSALDFSFTAVNDVVLGQVALGSGKADIKTSGSIFDDGDHTNTKVTAGSVSLTAGSSGDIGADGNAIDLDAAKLSVSAGGDVRVSSTQELTHLAVTSTNASTGSTKVFDFGAGSLVTLTDEGEDLRLGVGSLGHSITDFSLTTAKNIVVSDVFADGTVSLETTGTGQYSNISQSGSDTKIEAGKVVLKTGASNKTYGAIGNANQALVLSTSDLSITSKGSIYIDNSNTALTGLNLDLAHVDSNKATKQTYSFTNISGTTFTLTDNGTEVALGMTSSGVMNFALSMDRQIAASTIDAGTSSTGSVSLTTTGQASGQNEHGSISATSITAGSVTLNSYESVSATTTTQNLSINSSYNVNVTNNTTLDSLKLDVDRANVDQTDSSRNITYSISSTGLTFSGVTDNYSGNKGLEIGNITQSGLELEITAAKTVTVTKVDVGSGKFTLNAGESSIRAETGNAVITADQLTLNGGNVGRSSSGYFTVDVNKLSGSVKSSVMLSNSGDLAVSDLSVTSDDGSINLEVTNGNLTGIAGTNNISARDVYLQVANGNIGVFGNAVTTNARNLTIEGGSKIYLTNASDLFALNLTANHKDSNVNSYDIRAHGLTLNIQDIGSALDVTKLMDDTGINFDFSSDRSVYVGELNAGAANSLSITATGSGNSISADTIFSADGSSLSARNISLTSKGSIGTAGDQNRIKTTTKDLTLNTHANVYVDNQIHLASLSLTSDQATGGDAPVYILTSSGLTFDVTDNGTTNVNQVKDADAGLIFNLNTKRAQVIGTIDAGLSGSVTLTSPANITGADIDNHITAGTATFNTEGAAVLGSDATPLNLSVANLSTNTASDIYLTNDRLLSSLAIATHGDTDATIRIVGAEENHTLVSGQVSSANGTEYSAIDDNTGLTLTLSADGDMTIQDIDLDGIGEVNVSNSSGGSLYGDNDSETTINAAIVDLSSSGGSVGTDGKTIHITGGELSVYAGGGTDIGLLGRANFDSLRVGSGTAKVVNTTGDIALGESVSLNGQDFYLNNAGGSILSGKLSYAGNVTLIAAGSIGNVSAIQTIASGNGTTTLKEISATTNGRGATGSVNIAETYGLTVTSVSATSDVTLSAGTSESSTRTLTTGDIDAGTATVSLTSGHGAVEASSDTLITAGKLVISATSESIGTNSTAVKTTATALDLRAPGNIYVESTSDLSSLSIDRSNDKDNKYHSSGRVSITAINLTSWGVDVDDYDTTLDITDTTGLDFTYKSIEALKIGTINTGENGSVNLSASYRNRDDLEPEDTRYYGDITAVNGSSLITAGSVKLTAQGSAAAIGSSGTSLKIDTKTLEASSQSGGINVTNASALALSNITTSGDLSVTISSGDLTVDALSYGSGKNLTLTASNGHIYTGVGATLSLNSGNISLSASDGIGSNTSRLQLSGSGAGEFTADVTGTGSIYLNAQNGMSNKLVAKTANGAIDIVSNGNIALTDLSVGQDAVGNDIIVLAKSGNITIGDSNGSNGVVAGANNGKINLTAQNGAIYAGNASSALGAFEVRLTGANGVGTADNAIAASGQRVLVSATNAQAGVYLRSEVDGTFSSVSTNGGNISIKGSQGATILVANAVSGAGSASTAGNITISTAGSGGDLILGNINAKGSSSDGQITLTSTNGSVVDDAIDATRIVGSSLEVNAGTGVGTTERHLSTTVSQIIGNIAAGDVYIDDNNAAGVTLGTSQNALSLDDGSLLFSATNAVTLTNVVAKKDGETIDVTAADGDISVNSVLAGATSFDTDTQPSTSTVKLKATNGSILNARSDNSTVIMAGTLSLDAKNNVGALTWEDGESGDNSVRKPLQVIIKNLEATTGSDGSVIAIRNGGTDTLSLDKINGQAMTSVMVYSQGDITWGDAVTGRTLDKLMLSTSGTLTLADTVSATAIYLNGVKDIVSTNVDPRKLTLEATGASGIQIYSGSQGGTTTLNSTAKALDVQLLEGDTNSALVVSNTGALTKANLSAYNDVSLTNDVGVSGATITTNGENHTARITATTGDVTVGTINSGQTGTVALTATQGAIKFDGDQSVVTANVLTLTSFTGIGTEEQSFSTDVNTLNATVTGTGNIYTSYKANSSTGHLETHDGDIYVTGTSSLDVDLHHVWLEDGPNNESRKLVVTVIGGDVALSNALNGGNTVASLEVTAANISTDALTTGGSQSYTGTTTLNGNLTASAISINGNAILGANTMTLASTNGGDVKITGSVTGKDDQTGTALTVNAGAGDVGVGSATSHISQIALTGGNITVGNVTTSGTQTYTGTTTLGGGTYISGGDFKVAGATLLGTSTTVNTSSNNSNVTFDGAVDSDGQNYQGLEINSGYGTINFNGALGGTRLLNSIVLTSTSSQNDAPTDGQIVFASAANVNVYEDFKQNGGRRIALPSSIESEIGDIKIDGDAYLKAGASSIKALNDNEGGLVRFLGTITGNGSQLTVNAASAIEFNGAYADNAQGSTLALTAPNITVNAVTTKGAQSYTGATRILNNLTAGSIQIDGAASLAAQIVTFGLPETQTTTFDTSAANGNITLTGTLDGGSDIVVMKAGTGAVSIAGAATNVNNMTVSGSTISVHDVTTANAQDYTGVTTLNGTYQVGSDFTVTGASWIDDDTTIKTQDGTLSLKGTVNSVAHADLTLKLNLNGGNTTTHFDYALGNTNALGMLTINAGENGVTEFARTANISVIDGLVYTGGLKLLLPANITASNGPIKLGTLKLVDDTDPLDEIAVKPQSISGVIATLPSGNVTIRSGDDITIAGLIGKNTNLVMTSGTGDIRIGSKEGTSDQKIDVKSLNVATARTANLYGTIGGITGFDASYEIGPLKFAPYYINDAFWRNRDLPPAATKTTPLPKPPSTPQVDALFNLNTTSTGITPNVVGAFAAPTVLNVGTAPTNLSVAPSPTVITTPVSGSTGAGVVVTPPSGSGGIAGGNGAASSGGTATGDGATGTTTEGGDQPGVIGGQSDDTDLIQSNDQ